MIDSKPSDKAVTRACKASWAHEPTNFQPSSLRAALEAAHDPSLGLDRSVCLRDVVELFRAMENGFISRHGAADLIEREFGVGHD